MSKFSGDFEIPVRRIRVNPRPILAIAPIFMGLFLLIILISTSIVTISSEEVGVVLRLGKYSRQMKPGLNFKLPLGIDQVFKVPVQRQQKEEFGFRTLSPGINSVYSQEEFDQESIMLTGDLNVADVEWVTQYRINNPRDFLFKVRNLRETFRDMNEAIMREVVGDRSINEILTIGRSEIEIQVKETLQSKCNQYEMGIVVDQVILQDVNPPVQVKSSFNEVNQAQQEKEKFINLAQQEYNKTIPKAKGDASRIEQEALGYAVERTNRAQGEANRFHSLFQEYQKAPEVTRQRIYLETMESVLNQVGRKIIIDPATPTPLPILNLQQATVPNTTP